MTLLIRNNHYMPVDHPFLEGLREEIYARNTLMREISDQFVPHFREHIALYDTKVVLFPEARLHPNMIALEKAESSSDPDAGYQFYMSAPESNIAEMPLFPHRRSHNGRQYGAWSREPVVCWGYLIDDLHTPFPSHYLAVTYPTSTTPCRVWLIPAV